MDLWALPPCKGAWRPCKGPGRLTAIEGSRNLAKGPLWPETTGKPRGCLLGGNQPRAFLSAVAETRRGRGEEGRQG